MLQGILRTIYLPLEIRMDVLGADLLPSVGWRSSAASHTLQSMKSHAFLLFLLLLLLLPRPVPGSCYYRPSYHVRPGVVSVLNLLTDRKTCSWSCS